MPPSLSDWLPEGHLAWFIVDVVAELDLAEFYRSLRADGRGGASYDPEAMLGILLYAYCVGERSSRRVVSPMMWRSGWWQRINSRTMPPWPGSSPSSRRHRRCVRSGAGPVYHRGVGPDRGGSDRWHQIEADVSASSSVTRRQIVDEILEEAEAVDAAEDLEYGDRRGDELPEPWVDRRDRRARLREALRQLDADGPSDAESYQATRDAREAELGHKLPGRRADPNTKWASPARTRKINATDPDCRVIKDGRRYVQGYNAQAAVTTDQIVVAAEVTTAARDSVVFAAMVVATHNNLAEGGSQPVRTFVADTGYWSIDNATLDIDADILITPMPMTGGITDPNDLRREQSSTSRPPITAEDSRRRTGSVNHHRPQTPQALLRSSRPGRRSAKTWSNVTATRRSRLRQRNTDRRDVRQRQSQPRGSTIST